CRSFRLSPAFATRALRLRFSLDQLRNRATVSPQHLADQTGKVRACFAPCAVRHRRRGETARGVSKEADDATLPERRRAFAHGPGRTRDISIPDPDPDRVER